MEFRESWTLATVNEPEISTDLRQNYPGKAALWRCHANNQQPHYTKPHNGGSICRDITSITMA